MKELAFEKSKAIEDTQPIDKIIGDDDENNVLKRRSVQWSWIMRLSGFIVCLKLLNFTIWLYNLLDNLNSTRWGSNIVHNLCWL